MGDDDFNGQLLAEKLAKLNSSQQSIESLSSWCVNHRKKAKQIVETWDKLFKSAQREQRVSFLYLANDILQNSRRKGSEFVNEFWKVLPSALKNVYENGDEHGKKAASRLVDIWEERKVFGSRGQNLKDEMLGKNPPPSVPNGKNSNPIKVVKRDAHSLRIKLAVGGMPEKIVTAFQLVHDENANEEAALNKCKGAVSCVGEVEKDIENNSAQGNIQASELAGKIQEQENILQQCVNELETMEATRSALVSQLKEALRDQESKLDVVRNALQVARTQIEQATNMRQRLTSSLPIVSPTSTNPLMEAARVIESTLPSAHLANAPPLPPPPHLVTSFPTSRISEEESKKAAAAAVAAKLAASTSSAQMLTSVLSSLVAEEAASISGGLKLAGFSSSLPFGSPEKRAKLEKPAPFSDVNNSEGGNATFFASSQQQVVSMPMVPSGQSVSQSNQLQTPFPPPPPPLPPIPPANSPGSQMQSAATMMGGMPYGFGASNLPPPPLPLHIAMGLARPLPPLPQQQPQQVQSQQAQSQQQQPQPSNGSYYRPPGIGFYGQSHQPTPPPVPRQ